MPAKFFTGSTIFTGGSISRLLRCLPLLLSLLLLAGATNRTASAHALLVRSDPEANAELTSPPPSVEMWFSEPLESRFSHARLLDATGEEVASAGPSVVDATDPTHMVLPIGELTPGIYTVVWTTLSSVDGHEWIGSFPLILLNPDGSRPTGTAVSVAGERGELPSPVEGAARWLSLFGAILLAGGLIFRESVARPQLLKRKAQSLAVSIHLVWRWLAVAGIVTILLGGWLQIGLQVAALGAPERLLELLTNTRPGRLVLLRQLLLIPAVALLVAGESPAQLALRRGVRMQLWVWAEVLVALGMLATFPFTSHAAAVPGRGWAILGDFVHLLAAAVWMGGLLALALLFWQMRASSDGESGEGLGRIVRSFSLLAAASLFVLAATGLFSSVVQLPTIASLWSTTYGLVLLAKLGLVALALGIAYLNNRMIRNQLSGESGVQPRLIRQVGAEALVSLGLLVTVALLVQTPPPPRPQPYSAPALPYNNIGVADDLMIHLQITPNQPGVNNFWTHLYYPDGSFIGDVQLVRLFFAPKRAELGQARTDLPTEGNDIYIDDGAWMSQSGEWDVTVYVRRRGLDDVTADFTVTVPPPAGAISLGTLWENPAAALSSNGLLGGLLIALGLIPFLWWNALSRRNRGATPLLGGVGLACLILGVFAMGQALLASEPTQTADIPTFAGPVAPGAPTVSLVPTPVSPLAQSGPALPSGPTATPGPPAPTPLPTPTPTPDEAFLAGAEIFQANCARCHGPHGMGDGPVATTLPVQPAVLPFHIPMHPDENIYYFISEGFINVGMPAFKEVLSQEEILQVVRYLRIRFGGQSQ